MNRCSSACALPFALWCFCISATAQPFATGEAVYSKDSDGFRISGLTAGIGLYTSEENFYDRLGYKRSSVSYAAPGFDMHGDSDTVLGAMSLSSPLGPVKGEATLTSLRLPAWGTTTTGSMQISGQPAQAVNYEVRAEKNIVDSVNSLNNRVAYSAQTLAVDYQFTPLFNVAGVMGRLNFSDQNRRALWKAKATYVISEEHGIRTYLKAVRYANSLPYTGNYFSPENFRDYQAGLGFRRRLSMLHGVLSGYAEAGSQTADGVNNPVHGEQLRLEAFPNRPWYYDLAIGVQTSAGTGGGANYEYRYAKAAVVWPF